MVAYKGGLEEVGRERESQREGETDVIRRRMRRRGGGDIHR